MKVKIGRLNDELHFSAENPNGLSIEMDAVKEGKKAPSPMEVVLMGLGGCSSVDVVEILKKQKQVVEGYEVLLDAKRRTDETPATFEEIHMHFVLKGDIAEKKVARAIELSVDKYCSVAKMLEKSATITHSFEIVS